MFNPNTGDLFAGIAGVQLQISEFELEDGIVLSRAYGHVMAPLMMAFSPAEPGKHHPAPLAVVDGSFGVDFFVQLEIPSTFAPAEWFDRLNTAWWIVALLRVKVSPSITLPVIGDRAFHEMPAVWDKAQIFALEFTKPRMGFPALTKNEISESDLIWLKQNWRKGGHLMRTSPDFSAAMQAWDFCTTAGSPALAMMSIWGALEQLFAPAKQELRFRVSASIASFLEPAGESRLALHKKIIRLYDARSQAAHTAKAKLDQEVVDSFTLLRQVLVRMIEQNAVPDRTHLEHLLFGVS